MFIPPMLCTAIRDPRRLGDPRYMAEPKFDGQRAPVHVAGRRTLAIFSRPGRSLLAYPGLAWLGDARWPVDQALLDGELCAATGMEGVLSVFEARERRSQPMAFVAFDLLQLDGRDVMGEPWSDRRKRLEDLGDLLDLPNVTIVPVTDDAARLWTTWVGWGGEGIVLPRIGGLPIGPASALPSCSGCWIRIPRSAGKSCRISPMSRQREWLPSGRGWPRMALAQALSQQRRTATGVIASPPLDRTENGLYVGYLLRD